MNDRGEAVSLKSYLALGFGVESGFFSLDILVCELMFLRVFLNADQLGRSFLIMVDGRLDCQARKSRAGLEESVEEM